MIRTACALALGALIVASQASAHAHVSPPVAVTDVVQEFTLAVPNEEADADTTSIELTPPDGFSIISFAPTPGWTREVQATGEGEEATVAKVTWTGKAAPEEYASFHFVARATSAQTYRFAVRQSYSNGKVVDWAGPDGSETPKARLEAVSSLGGSSSSTWGIVALVVGGVALLLALGALAAKGERPAA